MRLGERKLEARLAGGVAISARIAVTDALLRAREDVAAGAEGDRLELVGEVRLERLGVGRDHRPAPGSQPGEDLGLGLGDRLERAQQLEVHRADVGDRGDVGLGDLAELGDLPDPAHRHLEHEQLGLRAARRRSSAAGRSRC